MLIINLKKYTLKKKEKYTIMILVHMKEKCIKIEIKFTYQRQIKICC